MTTLAVYKVIYYLVLAASIPNGAVCLYNIPLSVSRVEYYSVLLDEISTFWQHTRMDFVSKVIILTCFECL